MTDELTSIDEHPVIKSMRSAMRTAYFVGLCIGALLGFVAALVLL